MTMDRKWLSFPRFSSQYQEGVRSFIATAQASASDPERISCPCVNCRNSFHGDPDMLFEHLVIKGMDPAYTTWILHGERPREYHEREVDDNADAGETNTYRMYRDAFMENETTTFERTNGEEEPEFMQLLEEAETPLYPGCTKYTRMSALVVLFKHKISHGLSDKGFGELLDILRDMLPEYNTLPSSMYSAKKMLRMFGLGYDKIHACENDCCLFIKDNEKLEECPKCGVSRWRVNERTQMPKKGVPVKVLRYFPIIPRLRRMFLSQDMAEQMTWHSTHKSQDGKMRHPVDSVAWSNIERKWPSFASEPRNIRLGLAADGFNPFGNLSSAYSCWPVILVTYNLPSWMCMKSENMMLTLLIPGPKQPGNDIDVYLEPLIDDLKELWNNGVDAYDAFCKSKFNLKAVLMWTINDFPAYANLSGYSTKGELACPVCGVDTCSRRLEHGKKWCYMGHRRFLPADHAYRKNRSWFDGTQEYRPPPRPVSGHSALISVAHIENDFGKKDKTSKRKKTSVPSTPWKKKSIFFELPYWKSLLLRHNLDVMHIEKNICESLLNTLLNVTGKSKDNLNSRADLYKMNIRKDLHVPEGSTKLPPAPHTLSKKEKKLLCSRLRDLKVPDGFKDMSS